MIGMGFLNHLATAKGLLGLSACCREKRFLGKNMGFGWDRVGLLLFPLLISLAEGAFDFSASQA